MMALYRLFKIILILSLSLLALSSFVEAQTWPTSGDWISLGTDKGEDGTADNSRDVLSIYYYSDSSYLYLRMCCFDIPTFTQINPPREARYKWFIDLDGNSYISGGQVVEAEYLLFAEDTNNILPGEVYLLNDTNGDGFFDEWEHSPDYYSGGLVTNSAVAGYGIDVNCFDLYIAWSNIGNPANAWLIWSTDQENPNLEQSPETDSPDSGASIPIGPIPRCTPQPDNNCNGLDEDCDGTPDDGYVPTPTSCGVGVCARTGQNICQGGTIVNTCQPGTPQTEGPNGSPTCSDGLDNDCDGLTDAADPNCACVPTGPDTNCNGLDEDCDGTPDDGYVPTPTSCGTGTCSANGQLICQGGSLVNTCVPGAPQPDNNCNGIDNDCDGTADEHYVPTPTNCGVCVCAATGQLICVNGSTQNTCQPGTPTETPEKTCNDGKDNDCDGKIDGTDIDCSGAVVVGGTVIPVNKAALLIPWIAVCFLIVSIMASIAIWHKKRRSGH
jgi:hypothetical protein